MSVSNKRRPDFTPIGSIIGDVLRRHRPATTQAMLEVWDVWERAVGPDIAGQARPVAINGAILLVHVSNSSFLHHLRYMENELISRINQAFDEKRVQALKFKIGPL